MRYVGRLIGELGVVVVRHRRNSTVLVSTKVGGDGELARLCGVHASQISRWKRRKNGVIPSWHHQPILDGAAGKVAPEDFFESSAEAA